MTGLRELGRSGVEVGPLSFGAASIAGLYTPVSEAQADETIRSALDCGLRYLDTAPHYGAGLSEQRLATVLAGRPRDSFVVATKVGRRLRPRGAGEPADDSGFPGEPAYKREWDWSRDGIRRSLEGSLERLGLDHVDIAYLHDPDDHEDLVYASAYPALAELRDEGLVRAVGAGMNQTPMLTRFVTRLDLDVVLCAGRYTLLERTAAADLLPACVTRGVSVVIGGVFNSGLLAGPEPGARYDYAPVPDDVLAKALRLRDTCAAYGVPLQAAALRFPQRHPAVATVLVGARSPEEVRADVELLRHEVPDALWPALEA